MKFSTIVIFSTVSLAIFTSSCRKEKQSIFAPEPLAIEEREIRHEILAGVYNPADFTSPGKLQIFDYEGNVTWEKQLEGGMMNFARWDINGKYYYTYTGYEKPTNPIFGIGYLPGPNIVLDENMNEINSFDILPYNERMSHESPDGHDFILLGEQHYISLSYIEKRVYNIPDSFNAHPEVRVVACVVQEVKNGQVIFEWDGTNYPEFYATSIERNDYSKGNAVHDYLHVNSMFIDPNDDNIILSCRNTDQVIKIHRETGETLWRLGGKNSSFKITPDQVFLRQHHATIVDNGKTLLLFDNGEVASRPYSRILEFKLNEITKTVTGFKAVNLPANTFGQYMGSVQKTEDTYFIGCGSTPIAYEIDIKTQEVLLKKELVSAAYRSYKY